MENQDAVKYIISKLRAITTMVQIAPFIYALFCLAAYPIYLFASEDSAWIANMLLYVSPVVIVNNLINSRILKLCIWHKTTCVLPLVPNVVVIIDRFFYEFSVWNVTLNTIVFISMAVILLIAAYNVFFR